MKVKKLKKLLEGVPDNAEVVMSRDEEGNGFVPLVEVGEGRYWPDVDEEFCFITDEEEIKMMQNDSGKGKQAICLWP